MTREEEIADALYECVAPADAGLATLCIRCGSAGGRHADWCPTSKGRLLLGLPREGLNPAEYLETRRRLRLVAVAERLG